MYFCINQPSLYILFCHKILDYFSFKKEEEDT